MSGEKNAPFARPEPAQGLWPRLRGRLFHLWFRLRRPMTLGVRAVTFDPARGVFLIRHTYVPGWQLPGGGVETGETLGEALARELLEEGNIRVLGPPKLVSVHFNRAVSRRDHVAVFLVERFEQLGPKQPDLEIAESGFFPLDALPDATTAGTRRRLEEIFGGREASADW